jgi:hypothetical protein
MSEEIEPSKGFYKKKEAGAEKDLKKRKSLRGQVLHIQGCTIKKRKLQRRIVEETLLVLIGKDRVRLPGAAALAPPSLEAGTNVHEEALSGGIASGAAEFALWRLLFGCGRRRRKGSNGGDVLGVDFFVVDLGDAVIELVELAEHLEFLLDAARGPFADGEGLAALRGGQVLVVGVAAEAQVEFAGGVAFGGEPGGELGRELGRHAGRGELHDWGGDGGW